MLFERSNTVNKRHEVLRAVLFELSSQSVELVAQVVGLLFDLLAFPVNVFLQVESELVQVNFFGFGFDLFGNKIDSDQDLSNIDVRISFSRANIAHSLDHALKCLDLVLSMLHSSVGRFRTFLKFGYTGFKALESGIFDTR